MLKAIAQAGLAYHKTPEKWVVQCKRVGRGLPALQYLSRYLYRGVISNHNIIDDDGDFVIFQYKDSTTKQTKTRKMKGEDFIALVLQHRTQGVQARSRLWFFAWQCQTSIENYTMGAASFATKAAQNRTTKIYLQALS